MEKALSDKPCPRCGASELNDYYEDDADTLLGAVCAVCGFKGFYCGGRLLPLASPRVLFVTA